MEDKTDSDFSTFMKLGGAAARARDEYDAARHAISDAIKAHGATPDMWDRLRNAAHAYNDADIAYRRYLHDNHVTDDIPSPVSDFDPDNTMDYIRYLMKKINKLEADVAMLKTASTASAKVVASLEYDMSRVRDAVRPKTALDRKIEDWFASGENRLPDDDDPWWNMP